MLKFAEVMLESFQYEMQFKFLATHISELPAHTVSPKIRVHQLNAIHSVIQVSDAWFTSLCKFERRT